MIKISLLLLILFTAPFAVADEKTGLEREIRTSDRVVIAEVLELKPSMGFWSGLIPNVQCVRYIVRETLKGDELDGEIDVGHYVVHNSHTADKDRPQLSPVLFKKGNRLVLMLRTGRGGECGCLDNMNENGEFRTLPEIKGRSFMSPSENYGAWLADETILNLVHSAARKE